MKDEELIILLKYAYHLWRVAPTFKAQDEGLNSIGAFVGSVYAKAINDLENKTKVKFAKDGSVTSEQFQKMKYDIEKINKEYNFKYNGSFSMLL